MGVSLITKPYSRRIIVKLLNIGTQKIKRTAWFYKMDESLAILRPFHQYFSHNRTIVGQGDNERLWPAEMFMVEKIFAATSEDRGTRDR